MRPCPEHTTVRATSRVSFHDAVNAAFLPPAVAEQISDLRAENASLRRELARVKAIGAHYLALIAADRPNLARAVGMGMTQGEAAAYALLRRAQGIVSAEAVAEVAKVPTGQLANFARSIRRKLAAAGAPETIRGARAGGLIGYRLVASAPP